MFTALTKYAVFEGRARRSEYWLFQLLVVLAVLVLIGLSAALGASGGDDGAAAGGGLFVIGYVLAALVFFIPSLAVAVRRLHDIDRSGWWILINLIPFLGGLVFFIFMVMDGTPGANRYGPDPKNRRSYAPAATEVHHHYHGAPPTGVT